MVESNIKANLENPKELEKIYQNNPNLFKRVFYKIYPEIKHLQISDFWKVRLEFETSKEHKINFSKTDLFFLIISCVISGFLINIPDVFHIDLKHYFFHEKNVGLILFLGLSGYSVLTRESFNRKNTAILFGIFLVSAIYINLLPSIKESHSINLAYIHLPLLFWCVYGLVFINFDIKDKSKRIDYIKYNGDLAILTGLILIGGALLGGITIGLFFAIDIQITDFYFENFAFWGVVSAPIVATFIIHNNPFVSNKLAPIIANIFSPLVLITLIVYLISIPLAGKDPYNDREFLIIFNLMLLGVMAIIVFSVTETSVNKKQKLNELTLFILALVTLVINVVALSAILYRLGEFGFSPNRTAVLGSNLLIFIHLILIAIDLFKVNFQKEEISKVEQTISKFLPVYMLWTILVVFGFPLIFGLK